MSIEKFGNVKIYINDKEFKCENIEFKKNDNYENKKIKSNTQNLVISIPDERINEIVKNIEQNLIILCGNTIITDRCICCGNKLTMDDLYRGSCNKCAGIEIQKENI